MKYLDLRGKEVKDLQGNIIGYVDNLVIDFKSMRINSLIIRNTMFYNKYFIIPYREVKCLREFLVIEKGICKIKKSVLIRNKNILLHNYIDSIVNDNSGLPLGHLIDVLFDFMSGKFVAIIASSGFFEDLFKGRKVIAVNNNTSFLRKLITVEEDCFFMRNDMCFRKYFKD